MLDNVPEVAVPVALNVTEPIVVGEAHVALVPHSYRVMVGLVPHVRDIAEPVMLSTVDATDTLEYADFVLTTEVNIPG